VFYILSVFLTNCIVFI
jgi:hypothetical protein